MIKLLWFAVLLGCTPVLVAMPLQANTFDYTEVPEAQMIVVAAPINDSEHQLLILEHSVNPQHSVSQKKCWRESDPQAAPVKVDPELTYFDFTGTCALKTDRSHYSIRVGKRDLDWRYDLQLVKQVGDLLLVGVPTGNRDAPQLEIGRVGGWDNSFLKIQLNPGWRMARRTYMGEALGHIYFVNDQPLSAFVQRQMQVMPQPRT